MRDDDTKARSATRLDLVSERRRKPSAEPRIPDDISDEEEATIQAEIAANPDHPELTDGQIAAMRPASEVLPPTLYAKLAARGRPKAEVTKVPVKLRLDPQIVEAFKSTGKGWQTRMNEVLLLWSREIGSRSIGVGDFEVVPTAKGFGIEWRDEAVEPSPQDLRTRSGASRTVR